jgi:predicted RNA binding protein YcfA (HicA-like mRNA interferase family)
VKPVSGKQMCRLLEAKGWELKRISGSHHIYAKPDSEVRISIPVHGGTALKIGLQKHVMKLANIDESEL